MGGPPLGDLSPYYHYAMKWIHLHQKKEKESLQPSLYANDEQWALQSYLFNMTRVENEKTIVLLRCVTHSITQLIGPLCYNNEVLHGNTN